MAHVQHLVSFVQTAEHGSFSAAARVLGLTPAGVSKNVARLERDLGVRLFHRSTRRLALTESGERFLQQVEGPLASLQAAVAGARATRRRTRPARSRSAWARHSAATSWFRCWATSSPAIRACCPTGISTTARSTSSARASMPPSAAAFALASGVVARELAPVHIVAVASPAYLAGRPMPRSPTDLAPFDGIMRRSSPTGRVRPVDAALAPRWPSETVPCRPRLIFSDPEAIAQAARLGLGVALLPMPFAFALIDSGELVRLLPGWYSDAGPLSLYYPSRRMLPAKTRVFVDFVVERFRLGGFRASGRRALSAATAVAA